VPIPDPIADSKRERVILKGDVPSPVNPPSGCRFRTRCQYAEDVCAESRPEFREIKPGHFAACFFAEKFL
jgi:oligopeptide transport system ATP-binding protein